MNTSQLRYTLINTTLGSLVVNDPEGFDEAPLSLERDTVYSEVFKKYSSPLTFNQAAINYLESAEVLGIDTLVQLLVEYSDNYGKTWILFFTGLIDFETKNRIDFPTEYKLQYNTKQNDLWSAFYNRKSTAVNINSAVDLDGNVIAPAVVRNIPMPSQTVDRLTRFETLRFDDSSYQSLIWDITAVNKFGAIDLPNKIYDEIKIKSNLPPLAIPAFPVWIIDVDEEGDYDIDVSFTFANDDMSPTFGTPSLYFKVYIKYGLSSPTTVLFTQTDHGTIAVDQTSQHTYTDTVHLKKRDQITIYFEWGNPALVGTDSVYMVARGERPGWESYINILAHTISGTTTCEAILLHDVLDAIIKRTCQGSLYSPVLGGAAQGYGVDGADYPYVNLQGLQLRLYEFLTKPMAMSLDDFWAGGNPVFNWGLGTEVVDGVEKIYLDERNKFFDSSGYSIKLDYVNKVTKTRKFDTCYKAIEIGYSKWQLSAGGSQIDDPQTSHKYSSPFRYIGQTISQMSKWVAASLLFELTRRAVVKPTETWDLDNDVFLLNIKNDLSGPNLDGTATNLSNYATRYNKKLTPARAFYRWINVFNVGLAEKIASLTPKFVFQSGLGNFLASILILSEVPITVAENADIPITTNAVYGTDVAEFDRLTTQAEFDLIDAGKRKMIGISETNVDHEFYFIQKVSFYKLKGSAHFVLIKKAA